MPPRVFSADLSSSREVTLGNFRPPSAATSMVTTISSFAALEELDLQYADQVKTTSSSIKGWLPDLSFAQGIVDASQTWPHAMQS